METQLTALEIGARVMANQPLPEGVQAGAQGLVVGQAGWIQRRWRVRFDDGPTVSAPEYALEPCARGNRFVRA